MDGQPDPDIQIAGYRIEARVGRGGMGEVYRAVQLNLGRRVALKVLARDLAADDRFRRRFLRESRIAASIDHPSIIPIYEAGEDGDLLYIAMRYVDGPDLATVLRREGRLEPPRALAIMTQVAGALDAAHERGLVHRDVKPANILLAPGPAGTPGHCYLCDFGLIKQVDSEQVASALTATDQFVGTIPYVAPEQIEGKPLDGRTDVYSLGCVLFQCLTGSAPFEGSNDVEVVFAHLGKSPPSLSDRFPALPPSLDEVITRALAKSKEDRWPTCTSLVTALSAQMGAEMRSGAHGGARVPRAAQPLGLATTGPQGQGTGRPVASDPGAATEAFDPLDPANDSTVSSPAPPVPAAAPTAEAVNPAANAWGPAAPRSGSSGTPPSAPAPSPARSAARPVSARPGSEPPEGEATGPVEPVPRTVHRPQPGDRAPGKGRRARWWLTLAAAVVLPVGAYLTAVKVVGGTADPQVAAAPTTRQQAAPKPATCRWSRPQVGSQARSAPLAAIRAQMGWTDRFMVDEIRSWTGPDGNWRWYVKARQERNPSRRGRWLVRQQDDGQRLVLATAEYTTKGYSAPDWHPAPGQRPQLTGLAPCLTGT